MKIVILLLFVFVASIVWNRKEGFADKSSSLCEHNKNESCKKLTRKNCNDVKCCVWMSDDTCVAGNERGPTYNTDDNGKTREIDFYYYQNKRYGTRESI
jgi:hypothetical protein